MEATRRQRFMLFCLTKDTGWYDAEMTVEEASTEIGRLKRQQQAERVERLARKYAGMSNK
jgi:hypothetical protein